ncbi:MAG: hypothetical protein GX329_05195 [Tissierellia bacterium]|nr:hypothetical protein [Tissierellia bacterium]
MSNEQLFELITEMYADIQEEFKDIKSEIRVMGAKIDHDVIPKVNSLFDGYKQNAEELDRIEEEVSKHEEIILRRIK